MSDEFQVRELIEGDKPEWEILAQGYKEFYQTPTTPAEFEAAWQRILHENGIYGLGLWSRGELIGIAHYLIHQSTWASAVCYLQDMFVLPAHRGRGAGRALIVAIREQARVHGAMRYYWLTHESNLVARGLYEKLAKFSGFIRYDCVL